MMLSSSTADRVCGDRLATAPNLIAVGLLESDHQRTNGAARRPSWTGPPPSSRPGRLCIRFAVTRQAAGWRRTRLASYGSTSHKPWSTITTSRCLARSPPGPDIEGRARPTDAASQPRLPLRHRRLRPGSRSHILVRSTRRERVGSPARTRVRLLGHARSLGERVLYPTGEFPEFLARREPGTTGPQPKTRHAVSATENAQSHWPATAATAWATALVTACCQATRS